MLPPVPLRVPSPPLAAIPSPPLVGEVGRGGAEGVLYRLSRLRATLTRAAKAGKSRRRARFRLILPGRVPQITASIPLREPP